MITEEQEQKIRKMVERFKPKYIVDVMEPDGFDFGGNEDDAFHAGSDHGEHCTLEELKNILEAK